MTLDFALNPGKEEKEVFFEKLRAIVVSHEMNLQQMEQVFNERFDITTWESRSDVAQIILGQPNDMTTIADSLGRSKLNNRLFFCMTMQVATISIEMRNLAEECYDMFISPLCLYGDAALLEEGITDEHAQRGLGNILPLLEEIWNWVQRVNKVVVNMIRNFASLYSSAHQRDNYYPYTMVHFPVVWYALTELLGAVVSLEEVLRDHETLRQGIHVFNRMLTQISKNYDKYNADEFHIEQFGKFLKKLEVDILSDGILFSIVTQIFDTREVSVARNNVFFAEFNAVFMNIIETLRGAIGTLKEREARKMLVGVCGLYVLHYSIFKEKHTSDPKVFTNITEDVFSLYKKAPVIFINGLNVFKPAQWVSRKIPNSALSAVVKDPIKESMMAIKAECNRSAAEFVNRLNILTSITSIWIAQMESTYKSDRKSARTHNSTIIDLLQRGINFSYDLSLTIKNVIFLHLTADLPLTKSIVEGIVMGVQQLMMMRNVLHDKTAVIASTFNICIQTLSFNMYQKLFEFHSKLNDLLHVAGESVTDQHTALGQAMILLSRAQTQQNITVLDVTLSIAFQRGDCHFEPSEYKSVIDNLKVMDRIVNVQKKMKAATNCEFLYWQRESFYPIFFSHIFTNPRKSEFLPYLIQAMHDCCPAILGAKHTNGEKLLIKYQTYVRDTIQECIVEPLCSELENDLRLHTHGSVLGQPFRKIDRQARDPSRFTSLQPFRFFDEWLHIAALVEDYLDSQFYNLNALMTNDWKTYEEMRNLAKERYGLRIAEGYLPGSIVDQGLDVLVITKNIHVFITQYSYNMNEQLFIQRPAVTESKHLNTLHIRHVANSIRTHGTGIMNTTVNYVYKCLLKKLAILSQFLFDEQVKSRLMKDIKFFTNHKDELNGLFPIHRAEKFNNDIKKLGVTDDGRSCLDQFRQLVAEIGNALGYMRMVRSGGLRAIADAAVFIPSMEDIPRLEKYVNPAAGDDEEDEDELTVAVRKAKLEEEDDDDEEEDKGPTAPPCTVDSIRIVDNVVTNMNKRLSDGSDYFRMLEEGISRKLSDAEKYNHLKNFYMIIPAMCMLHVEFMIKQKEQLVKKNREGLFTDDGFALGCVFLLSLFRVFEQYESLHWFEAINNHFHAKQAEMQKGIKERQEREARKKKEKEKARANSKNTKQRDSDEEQYDEEDDDLKTMQLTLTMVDSSIREYSTLDNCFASSRVFFRYHVEDEDEEEEEED